MSRSSPPLVLFTNNMNADIYEQITELAEDHVDHKRYEGIDSEQFFKTLRERFPNLTSHPETPQRLYVQRFPNCTFGTKIFWSKVPGMNLVEFITEQGGSSARVDGSGKSGQSNNSPQGDQS